MKAVEVRNLTFSYSGYDDPALDRVSFDVERGEIMLVIGESGCGKTTLLRHLKPSQIPIGRVNASRQIEILGQPIEKLSEKEAAFNIGFVGQQVDESLVTDKVWHELAFGLESMGCEQAYMQQRVAEITSFFGLEKIYHEKISELSGGLKQIVNLASVMIMEPEILILDEPTSQLDPNSSAEFFHMIKKIHEELGTTIIVTEHRLEDILPMADKVMVLRGGRNLITGPAKQVCRFLHEKNLSLYRSMPVASRIYCTVKGEGDMPLSVNDGRKYLRSVIDICEEDVSEGITAGKEKLKKEKKIKKDIAVTVDEVWFRYRKKGTDVLKACDLLVQKGRITAILGGNGAGKSTLLHVINGNLVPYLGKVRLGNNSTSLLPQNPQAMFFAETVREELEEAYKLDEEKVSRLVDYFGLSDYMDRHPFDLSGGQMEKLALVKIIMMDKDVILLDEPGKGMDYAFKEKLGELLTELKERGKTILLVSHDVEFCAKYADYCGMFFDGHIVSLSDKRTFFLQNAFYTTAVRRMTRGICDAVTIDDVYDLLNVEEQAVADDDWDDDVDDDDNSNGECGIKDVDEDCSIDSDIGKEKAHRSIRNILPPLLLLAVMPFTIYVGYALLHQRKYYFISLMLIVEAVTAFFLSFEERRPQMRDIMTIAVMSAITALSRAMFYMVPAVKPMAALTIISGVGLGSVAGFVVGALSMLVSDIFFGQGPWTPWQMFTMGLLGFLGGLFFRNNKKRTMAISVFGALAVLIIYGGIMNPASILMYQENVTAKMLLASYIPGFPIDCIHAVATFVFLWLLTDPMLKKFARVKKK